jgi:DNA polymerase-3 subunit epsilon
MGIERALNRTSNHEDVRLFAIRERRGLPAYDAHNALVDSLSTAEVLLVQIKDIFKDKDATVMPLFKRSN